jgi:hypothetical protein
MNALLKGIAAGSVATAALNVVTYGDMVVRGRPSSETPSKLVKSLATSLGIEPLAAEGEAADNRRSGAGALLGFVNGLGVGVAYAGLRPALRGVPPFFAGVLAGAAAMALSDVPMAKAGVTDPSTWGAEGWLADIIPHLAYGLALAYTYDALAVRR